VIFDLEVAAEGEKVEEFLEKVDVNSLKVLDERILIPAANHHCSQPRVKELSVPVFLVKQRLISLTDEVDVAAPPYFDKKVKNPRIAASIDQSPNCLGP
jgi:hypothetical protein